MRVQGTVPYVVRTAPQQVAAAIKQDILEGKLKPDDMLPPELELAALFGVSRPTVRAGLQELCAAQILTVQRGRSGGYRVAHFSLETLETSVRDHLSLSLVVQTLQPQDFLEVRFAHELLCAETAARRCSPRGLRRLEELHELIDRSLLVESSSDDGGLPPERRRAFELDLEFHRALAEATGNPLILSFEGALIAVLHRFLGDGVSVSPHKSLGNVGEVVDAVRDGDPVAAREAMRSHLRHSAAHYGLDPSFIGGVGHPERAAGATEGA